MEIGDRIRVAREAAGISKSELARRIGVHPSACIQWESRDGTYPKLENLIQLAVLLDVRLEWLGTGRGAMHYGGGAREERPGYAGAEPRLAADERRVLGLYRNLPPRKRKALFELLDHLEEAGQKGKRKEQG